jgi:hypothetical protein
MTHLIIDMTHIGRHVTGIERVTIDQFEKAEFPGATLSTVKDAA